MKTLFSRIRMTLALRRSAAYSWRLAWRKTEFLSRNLDDVHLGI